MNQLPTTNYKLSANSYQLKASHSGQLLLEVLVAVGMAGAIIGLGAGLLYVGLKSSKSVVERNNAITLVEETADILRSIAFERWSGETSDEELKGISDLTPGSANLYYPERISGICSRFSKLFSLCQPIQGSSSPLYIKHLGASGASTTWGAFDVNGVSALDSRDVWITGNAPASGNDNVWRYDGEDWNQMSTKTGYPAGLRNLYDVAALRVPSVSTVIAVGADGRVAEYSSLTDAWTDRTAAADAACTIGTNDLLGVSYHGSNSLYTVGEGGNACKWSGSAWSDQTLSGVSGTPTLRGVAGISTVDDGDIIWTAGDSGNIWRNDNTGSVDVWDQVTTATGCTLGSTNFYGVSLSSSSKAVNGGTAKTINTGEAWVVGDDGRVLQFQPTFSTGNLGDLDLTCHDHTPTSATDRWGNVTGTKIRSVAAYAPDKVYIVGNDGIAWQWVNDITSCTSGWCQVVNTNKWGTRVLNDVSDRYSPSVWFVGNKSAGDANNNTVWEHGSAKWKTCRSNSSLSDCIPGISTPNNNKVTLNNIEYTRNFYLERVCRHDTARNITGLTDTNGTTQACTSSGGSYDPSTLKATAEVKWGGDSCPTGNNCLTKSEYLTRWASSACNQTSWTTADTAANPQKCPTVKYDSMTNIAGVSDFEAANNNLVLKIGIYTGTLTSTTFETTGLFRGPAYNSIRWLGDGGTGKVRFRIATSDCPDGDNDYPNCADNSGWADSKFYGPNCTANGFAPTAGFDDYVPEQDTPMELKCVPQFENNRYFRYKIKLCRDNTAPVCEAVELPIPASPTVSDIYLTWSP